MGPTRAIDINHQAIHEAMRLYDIPDKRKCFEKVHVMIRWWISKVNRDIGVNEKN